MHRSGTRATAGVYVGSGIEQRLDYPNATAIGGIVQWRVARIVASVDVGSGGEQSTCRLSLAVDGGEMERRALPSVASTDIRSGIEQRLDCPDVAPGGIVEGCVA